MSSHDLTMLPVLACLASDGGTTDGVGSGGVLRRTAAAPAAPSAGSASRAGASPAENRYRRYCLGLDLHRVGVGHDGARAGAVLWRDGAIEECPGDDHAELHHPLPDQSPVGPLGLSALAFGPDKGHLIGGLEWLGLNGVGLEPNADYAATVPHQAFMIFQMMFAVITPALITGAFAERMKFSSFLVFTLLWATFIYDPLAHWVWAVGGWVRNLGALDFAGGTVVHISSGARRLGLRHRLAEAVGLWQRAYGPAQSAHDRLGSEPALVRVVRVQCRQRGGLRRAGDQRLCGDQYGDGRCGAGLDDRWNGCIEASRRCLARRAALWQDWWRLRRRPGLSVRCRRF